MTRSELAPVHLIIEGVTPSAGRFYICKERGTAGLGRLFPRPRVFVGNDHFHRALRYERACTKTELFLLDK
jgi:hypothetical protein